jgi:3-phosphoglycerate kinase
MTGFRTLDEADVHDKRVLLRVDLNVPIQDGKVGDLTRIERVVPTIAEIVGKGGKVILLSLGKTRSARAVPRHAGERRRSAGHDPRSGAS